METTELLKKIKTIPINTGILADELLAGNFSSVFKGQGVEFDELRHYQPGDDIRSIDWNACARFGKPFIKLYREERDMTILIVMDTSASMHRDSGTFRPETASEKRLSPYEQGVLAAALIAFSAEKKSQRVGALLFDSGIHRVFLPRKGRHHLMALTGSLIQNQKYVQRKNPVSHNETKGTGSNIAGALSGAERLLKRRSLVVLVSDFLSVNWETQLAALCRKHNVLALRVSDPADVQLPERGLAVMEDPETGLKITAPAFRSFREAWKEWHVQRAEIWAAACRRAAAAHLELPVTIDAASALYRFFSTASADSFLRKGIRSRPFYSGDF